MAGKVKFTELGDVLGKIGEEMPRVASVILRRGAEIIVRPNIIKSIRDNELQDRGGLMRSFETVEFSPTRVGVISSLPYARIQDTGGPIVPREKRALTVPVSPKAKHRRAADFPNAFIVSSEDTGKGFIAVKKGKGIELLFALRQRVELQPTHYLDEAHEKTNDELVPFIEGQVVDAIGGQI